MEASRFHFRYFCFFSMGFWTNFVANMVARTAIEDILAGTLWSSTVVLLTYSLPEIIAKTIGPYVVNRISFRCAYVILTLLLTGSCVLMMAIDDVWMRMVGVGVLGMGTGFGMIICVRMLAYYEYSDVHANASYNGLNYSTLGSTLIYSGLTTWACLAPRLVMAICIPCCFLPLVFYLLIDKEPLKDHLNKNVQYTALNKDDDDDSTDDDEAPTPISQQNSRILFLYKAFPSAAYLYTINFCTHFVMTAVVTTITFESSPFSPRDHYQYYTLVNTIATPIAGTVSLVSSCLDKKWSDFFRIRKKMWVLSLLDVILLVVFVFASWYRFLPNVYLVLVMLFTLGIFGGLGFVNCGANSASLFSNPRDSGTAIGMMELGVSASRVLAALLGLSTEKLLREHCTNRLLLGQFCLARHPSNAEWITNLSCKTRNL